MHLIFLKCKANFWNRISTWVHIYFLLYHFYLSFIQWFSEWKESARAREKKKRFFSAHRFKYLMCQKIRLRLDYLHRGRSANHRLFWVEPSLSTFCLYLSFVWLVYIECKRNFLLNNQIGIVQIGFDGKMADTTEGLF